MSTRKRLALLLSLALLLPVLVFAQEAPRGIKG